MLPSAFGNPAQFKPVVELYRERFAGYGHGLSIDMGGQPAKEFVEMTELIGTHVIPQLS